MKFATRGAVVPVPGTAADYSVRVPLKADRIEFARRVRAAGGRPHGDAALIARVAAMLDRLFADDAEERARLVAIVREYGERLPQIQERLGAAWRALLRRAKEAPPADGAAPAESAAAVIAPHVEALRGFAPLAEDFARIERLVEEVDAGLRDMKADNDTYMQFYSLVAAEMFVAGYVPRPAWRGRAGAPLPPFRQAGGRLAPDVLEALPDEDILAIGAAIVAATSPTEAERKNFDSPPGTSPGGDISTDLNTGRPTSPPPATSAESPSTAS